MTDNKPQKLNSIPIIDKPEFHTKTFRLSADAYEILEILVERFSKEAQIRISSGKVVELALFAIADASLLELLKTE